MSKKKRSPKTVRKTRFISFLSELKERKVLRVALAYIVVTWVVIQVGDATFTALNLPPWSITLLILLIILGFPFAMLLAWAYELTPDGIVEDVDGKSDSRPVDIYRSITENSYSGNSTPSIAVLKFEDMSVEQDQSYFCEGIAEEILCALNEIEGLRVAARLASFQFGSKSANVLEVGRKLNVSVILEGSVRKSDNKIRTTIQLINARDGYQFWAGQYNHDLKDIFEIQEQIAQAVVNAMRITIGDHLLMRPITRSSEAYDLYLKAKSYFNHPDRQNILFARQFFTRAVEVDPEFGRAWAKLAATYAYEHLCCDPNGNAKSEARRVSKIALRLAPGIPDTHIARGITYAIYFDYAQADLEFDTATNLDPGSFNAWFTWARSKTYEGDTAKAVEYFQKASEVRQEDYQSVLMQVGFLTELGDSDGARKKAQEGLRRAKAFLELNPEETRAWNMGAFALKKLGRTAEAIKWMETSMENAPRNSILTYNAASFYASMNDADKALEYLAQAARSGCLNLAWLEQDKGIENLKADPRYQELVSHFKKRSNCSCSCVNANPACI